jgi:hypothetical protein
MDTGVLWSARSRPTHSCGRSSSWRARSLSTCTRLLLGTAAEQTTFLRRRQDGVVLARAGWLAGIGWVLGMGLRFAFLLWISHGGAPSLAHFSATHAITSAAWSPGLLAMAVGEVLGRSALLLARRHRARVAPARRTELA